ncbi:MAG: caspase family protein [Pseudomonadota bacterium]
MRIRNLRIWCVSMLAAVFLSAALQGCVTTGDAPAPVAQKQEESAFEKGKALYEQGNYESALPLFTAAAKAEPANWVYYNWIGWTYYYLKKYDEGIIQFKVANTLKETGVNYNGLGQSYTALEDYNAAVVNYKKFAQLEPANWEPYNLLGWAYYNLGKYQDGIVQFKIANTLKEESGNYAGLGKANCEREQYEAANAAFSSALKIAQNQPEKDQLNFAWATCNVAKGDYQKAFEILGQKPFLGMRIAQTTEGINIQEVFKGAPAELAGLKSGDVVISFNGQGLAGVTVKQFLEVILGKVAFGAQVPIQVKRGNGVFESTVQVGITPQMAEFKSTPKPTAPVPSVAATPAGMRWAVIIGISDYKDSKIPQLRYAAADARAFKDWITATDGGRYAPANVKLLIDTDATGRNIKAALFEWLKRALEEDMVVIYFAGHGSPESPDSPGNLFLLPYDTQYDSIATTGFPMWDIETALKRYIRPKKVVVIADACHSGGVGQSFDVARRDSRAVTVNPISAGIQGLSQTGDGVCVISASGESQYSQESREWGGGHGVFTYYLLKGLAGDADYNKNVSVSLGELTSYLSEQVRRETKNAQSPTVAGRYDPALAIGK